MKKGVIKNAKIVIATSMAWLMIFSVGAVFANQERVEALRGGVSVRLNGELLEFAADSQPVSIEGRTFLPVRAIADAVGLDVDWDPTTSTVSLTDAVSSPALPQATRLSETLVSSTDPSAGLFARAADSASIFGTTHSNVMHYAAHMQRTVNSQHNLSGNFTRLTGTFGRMDNSLQLSDATVTIYGDGVVLHTFEFSQHAVPVAIDLDVTGVQMLRVDVSRTTGATMTANANQRTYWAFSADLR